MKKRYLPQVSAILNRGNHYGLLLASLTILSLFCARVSSAQKAFWLESINNNVKQISVASVPVAASGATTLATPNIPLYIFEDERNGLVYWSDAGTGTIKRVSTSGGAVTNVVTGITGTGVYPRGIYVDVTANTLYWAETAPGLTDVIKKVNIAGGLPKSASTGNSVVTAIDIVRGITVDTTANTVYYADAGAGGSGTGIYRAGTVGAPTTEATSTKVAVVTAGAQPNSLFLDRIGNLIYWCEFTATGKIQRATTNGTLPADVVNVYTGINSIRGISADLNANTVYWTEYPSLLIKKAGLSTIPIASTTNVVTGLLYLPRNVQIVPGSTCVNVGIGSATAGTSPICSNATTTLTANLVTGTNAVVTWWTGPGGTGTNLGTGLTLTLRPPGTYYARVTGDCGTPVEASVTVASKTDVGIGSATAGTSPICSNATTTLTANLVTGTNAVVTWWSGPGGTGTNLGTGLTLTNRPPGTYYARVTGDCGTPVEASVTVASKINVGIGSATAGTSPICSNATTTLTANLVTGTNAVVTWWTGPGGTGTNMGTGLTLTNRPPGTYYARVTGDCGTPVEASVTVASKIVVGIGSATAGTSPICSNATTTLTANLVTGTNAVVTWWTGTGGTGTNLGTGLTLTNRPPGTYYARVTGDCGTPVEASVTVASKIDVGIGSATAGTSPICSNATTTLTANLVTGTNAVVTWWTGTGGTGTNLGTGLTLTNRPPGTFYARVTGDCGTPEEASVTVAGKINVGIGNVTAINNPICPAATTTITSNGVTGTNAVLTWWTGPGGTGTNLGSSPSLVVGIGTYYARVTGDCGAPAEASITINPVPPPVCGSLTNRIYVDINNCAPGNGSSWNCSVNQLRDAIVMANSNPAIKSIWVADGIYKPTGGNDRTAVMATTRADLVILGGFAGGELNASDANPALNPTIISGDIGVANDMADNSYRLFNIGGSPVSSNALLIEGFIFERGNANAPGDGDKSVGAAILSYGIPAGTPVQIRRCTFRNNFGTATGAIFLMNSNIAFDGCRFATNNTNGSGGAVLVFQASPTFNNCVFAGNTAAVSAGAFYGNYGTAAFTKCVFTGNSAGTGGAVFQNRYTAGVSNCVFNGNASISGGGAMYLHNTSIGNILNNTFYGNSAVTSGGALLLAVANSSVIAFNNIFYKNTAAGSPIGAGSDITNFTSGSNVYANNILQAGSLVPADNGTGIRNNQRGVDPLFVNGSNPVGADVTWSTPDDGLQLQSCVAANCGPAINTGDNTPLNATGVTTDIRNNTRIICSIVDLGAYENQDCVLPPISDNSSLLTHQQLKTNDILLAVVANPFKDDLQIRFSSTGQCSIGVLSSSGKTVWQSGKLAPGIIRINSSSWSSGIYHVVLLAADGKRVNLKVVKL
ncbi:MAG: right-handed parallel beta-helix repeat-containing protein [Bacteroidota bacterium]